MDRKEFIIQIGGIAGILMVAPYLLAKKEKTGKGMWTQMESENIHPLQEPVVGKNFSTFELRFSGHYLRKYDVMIGPNGHKILIKEGPDLLWDEPVNKYSYTCCLITTDPEEGIPVSMLKPIKESKRLYSVMEHILEKRNG